VLRLLELAASRLAFAVDDRYTLRMAGAISPEYQKKLAAQLEQLPRARLIGRMFAKWLLDQRASKPGADDGSSAIGCFGINFD
jgi:hypothetical protein